jgi:hypothetical protein
MWSRISSRISASTVFERQSVRHMIRTRFQIPGMGKVNIPGFYAVSPFKGAFLNTIGVYPTFP